jgi:DNA-binding NtrC family response regulator
VLVVDEQANQSRVVAIGLRLEGFDVETAAGAADALAKLAAQPFDLAIVDLMLPGTNGIQLARLVRERHPQTHVVLTSAYHLSERQLSRADCGAVGVVPKPVALGDLAEFLRRRLDAAARDGGAATVQASFATPSDSAPRARQVAGAAAPR